MKAVKALPEAYQEIYTVDLQKERKTALLVNLIALFLAAALIVPMLFLVPISGLFVPARGFGSLLFRLFSFVVLMLAYFVLHELVHGVAMKLCGTEKVKYGFTGMYAFAGSDDYYSKKAYIFIALTPVILWGIVLAVINPLVPLEWFWVIYLIQVTNISGAAGDLFVTVRFSRFPKDILVRDCGVGMTVYSKESCREAATL